MSHTYAQRMRVTFATDDTVKYVGHLDMYRAWERAVRRAQLPLSYSQGFHPQPRLHFASALAVGCTGEAEKADVFLDEELVPGQFLARLASALPPGIRPYSAEPVSRDQPSLQSLVCGATYRVSVDAGEPIDAFRGRLEAFLAEAEVWRERRKGHDVVRYDLRPLVLALEYVGPWEATAPTVPPPSSTSKEGGGHVLEARLRAEPGATGRPDELLGALGLDAALRRIVRSNLILRC